MYLIVQLEKKSCILYKQIKCFGKSVFNTIHISTADLPRIAIPSFNIIM